MAAFTSFLSLSYVIFCSAPAPVPYVPWPGYFQGFLGPFTSFWLPPLLQACCRHVTSMLQACYKHGHFHLAAYASQVRW